MGALCLKQVVRTKRGRRVRVLHITPSFYPALVYGGPTRSVHQLCIALAEVGCEVRVLTTDANGPDAELDVETDREIRLRDGLRVRYCHRVMDVSISPALLLHLNSYVRWADVIHLTSVYSFPTMPTLLAARLYEKPVVWSPRGMLQRWSGSRRPQLKSLWERVCRLVSPGQLILHVTSEEEAAESTKRLSGARVALVPNGVNVPDSIRHLGGDGTVRLVYLGRVDPKKGIENLLDACRILEASPGFNYSLKIAGGGVPFYIASIKAQVERLGLTERVQLVGNVEGEEKESLLAHADVVVVPSHTENFGLVVAEALAYGLPVIASRGTPWRRLEEIGCGLWVGNDPESLAKAIAGMSSRPLREMGRRGREWMKREFAWTSLAAQMINVYRDARTMHEKSKTQHSNNFHVIQ